MRLLKRTLIVVGLAMALRLGWAVWSIVRAPATPPSSPGIVNDVSQLNPIHVDQVLTATTTEEIIDAVRLHHGPVSIGGARHSMGGQIATEGALFLDMRHFDRILDFSPTARTITAQAGATWRQIQARIDPSNLSVSIMQSYANFTLGGSVSVNGHGRYVGVGPLIHSVRSLKLVLADGSLVEASPSKNADIFDAAIGGYGGIGVITEATLALTDNIRVKRHSEVMPISKYHAYFFDHVRSQSSAIFHSANIFPDTYTDIRAITFLQTSDPVTVPDRLFPVDDSYGLNRFAFWIQSDWPLGKKIARYVIDPLYFEGEPVEWRNYEASRDVAELEPASRSDSTYVLQEYFVPVERFDDFVPQLRRILESHRVNVVNVSVRHADPDPGSLLAWARTEVFAFVIYYKQATTGAAEAEVRVWTRELIDAALDVGGSYYLPYQLHATEAQFRRAYPQATEYFDLKRRVDPTNKLRNKLLDKYGW